MISSKERFGKIKDVLEKIYPSPLHELNFNNAYQLLVAVILAARCTDKLVNERTPSLFANYPTMESMSTANPTELFSFVKDITYIETKIPHIIQSAKEIMQRYNGEVPSNLTELLTLPGIGRKSANTILAEAFHIDAIAIDTHTARVSQRTGLTKSKDLLQIEKDLMRIIPQTEWIRTSHQLILFGRYICQAINPLCSDCPIREWCLTKNPVSDIQLSLF